jgi:hypothetical protein
LTADLAPHPKVQVKATAKASAPRSRNSIVKVRSATSSDCRCRPAPVERRRFLGLELAPHALDDAAGIIMATGAPIATPERIAA